MKLFNVKNVIISRVWLLSLICALQFLSVQTAEARVGGGRSVGRSFGGSSGGFRRSPPPPSSSGYNNNYNNQARYGNNNAIPPAASGGGFFRSVAGGMAGGFLGSMLFSSLGHSGGMGYGGGGMGYGGAGGGGGIGFFEILLFAGLGFIAYRWWRNKQQQEAYSPPYEMPTQAQRAYEQDHFHAQSYPSLAVQGIATEDATDLFFKIQGAWTRRNMSLVSAQLGPELKDILSKDAEELQRGQKINRLENITIRKSEVLNSWEESDGIYSTVNFSANLLDYTVDEKTGAVVSGSDANPVKFEENWTFFKSAREYQWKLVGIDQPQ